MNNLVEFEYDSFEKINKVTLKKNVRPKVRILKKTIRLSKLDATFLGFQENGGQSEIGIYLAFDSYAAFDSLLIKFDDSEVLTLQLLRTWHNNNLIASFYGCSQDILKKMCDANNVEFRVKYNEDYLDFTLDDIGLAACAIFNALIDENAYVEEIKEREAVEIAREAKKNEYKANAAARLAKARKQKQQHEENVKKQKQQQEEKAKMFKVAFYCYFIVLVGGGIWSLFAASWTPIISLFILVSVVLIIMAIVRNS